ncbi:MAG: hypothetical protein AAB583_01585 [Patescibacteria group bacterium]
MLEQYFGYQPPLPEKQQRGYESASHKVLRWQNGNWPDNIYETDWDHVVGMFFVLSDIKRACPTLSSDVDIETAEHMIYLHDAGEILVGDLTHNRDDYYDLYNRWKSRERAAFRLLTKAIEDEGIKKQARELYKRYVVQDSSDKEALLTRLIDMDQGSRFGFRNVFHGKGMRRAEREMQFNHTMELLAKPTKPLLKLVSPSTQEGLKNFLKDDLGRFSQHGYTREAAYYIRNLDVILQ